MDRYVNFSDRNFFSINNLYGDFFSEYSQGIKHVKWNNFKWKGMTLMKDPMSLSIYQQLIQDLLPKTIIEFGTYDGGSASWMNDICKSLDIETKIYTFDKCFERVNKNLDENIKFFNLDNYNIKEFIKQNVKIFEGMVHPILVIEDSHENFVEVIEEIDIFLSCGDYLIVEDTIDECKHNALSLFLENKKYKVDAKYCDFWGYNNTWNYNSFLVKE